MQDGRCFNSAGKSGFCRACGKRRLCFILLTRFRTGLDNNSFINFSLVVCTEILWYNNEKSHNCSDLHEQFRVINYRIMLMKFYNRPVGRRHGCASMHDREKPSLVCRLCEVYSDVERY